MGGTFTISLDFEIHWGVSDHRTIESYKENLTNVPKVVNRLLEVFTSKGIHCTWATVGMLFCRNKAELFQFVKPGDYPAYRDPRLSNYTVAETAGNSESDDPFHFAPTLVEKIRNTPGQEMATHTFSHYYCLEPGQTPDQFFHDLGAAREIAAQTGIELHSIVFPRNQYRREYLQQCRLQGIKTFRGNYQSWIYKPEAKSTEKLWKRFARLADNYLSINGSRHVTTSMEEGLLNIPGSCFLRPYSPKLAVLEPLRISRIKKEMTEAARRDKIYHLWWHPHNFGSHMDKNFAVLDQILDHFLFLRESMGMQCRNMKEIYDLTLTTK